jgi:hypothetical protein
VRIPGKVPDETTDLPPPATAGHHVPFPGCDLSDGEALAKGKDFRPEKYVLTTQIIDCLSRYRGILLTLTNQEVNLLPTFELQLTILNIEMETSTNALSSTNVSR